MMDLRDLWLEAFEADDIQSKDDRATDRDPHHVRGVPWVDVEHVGRYDFHSLAAMFHDHPLDARDLPVFYANEQGRAAHAQETTGAADTRETEMRLCERIGDGVRVVILHDCHNEFGRYVLGRTRWRVRIRRG